MRLENKKTLSFGFAFKYLFILSPFWLEFVDFENYLLAIPGFPYSLGMIAFMFLGLPKFRVYKDWNNDMVKALIIILLGIFLGSFFGNLVYESLSRSIGLIPLVFSIIGFSYYFEYKLFKSFLDLVFIVIFIRWSLYVITIIFLDGSLNSYSDAFVFGDRVTNHHIPGFYITVSAIYIINRFCFDKKRYTISAYLLLAFSLVMCVILESRSNLIFLLFTFIFGLYFVKKKISGFVKSTSLIVIAFIFIFSYFFKDIDFISQRFDATDSEYLENSNRGRSLAYIGFLPTVLSNPLGKGIKDIYVDIGLDFKVLMHNQYATFILAGGIISFLGIYFLILGHIRMAKSVYRSTDQISYSEFALFMSGTLFLLTLSSIELFGGAVANLMFGGLIYLGRKSVQI
jgi:hypothetical protein